MSKSLESRVEFVESVARELGFIVEHAAAHRLVLYTNSLRAFRYEVAIDVEGKIAGKDKPYVANFYAGGKMAPRALVGGSDEQLREYLMAGSDS